MLILDSDDKKKSKVRFWWRNSKARFWWKNIQTLYWWRKNFKARYDDEKNSMLDSDNEELPNLNFDDEKFQSSILMVKIPMLDSNDEELPKLDSDDEENRMLVPDD